MTTFELLSIVVALLSCVLALVALVRTRGHNAELIKIQRDQAKLQSTTVELQKQATATAQQLAEFEVATHKAAAAAKKRAWIKAEIRRGRGSLHHLVLTNSGPGAASQVDITFESHAGNESPLLDGEEKKLPFTRVGPGENRMLELLFSSASSPPYDVSITWHDESGEERSATTTLL